MRKVTDAEGISAFVSVIGAKADIGDRLWGTEGTSDGSQPA